MGAFIWRLLTKCWVLAYLHVPDCSEESNYYRPGRFSGKTIGWRPIKNLWSLIHASLIIFDWLPPTYLSIALPWTPLSRVYDAVQFSLYNRMGAILKKTTKMTWWNQGLVFVGYCLQELAEWEISGRKIRRKDWGFFLGVFLSLGLVSGEVYTLDYKL